MAEGAPRAKCRLGRWPELGVGAGGCGAAADGPRKGVLLGLYQR